LLLRYELRREGCSGGLREPLRWMATRDQGDDVDGGGSKAAGVSPTRSDLLARFVARLVPGVDVVARPVTAKFASMLRRAKSGVSASVDLYVDLHDDARPLRVGLPDSRHLIPEPIALAVDTAVAVR